MENYEMISWNQMIIVEQSKCGKYPTESLILDNKNNINWKN